MNKPKEDFDYDVFLAYAKPDLPKVRPLAERLKGDGLRVWFDEWVILPGDSTPRATEGGLDNSRTLLLVMSKAAFASEQFKLLRDAVLFRDPNNRKKRFVPLLLSDCTVPSTLAIFKAIDWRKKNEDQYLQLVAGLTQRYHAEYESNFLRLKESDNELTAYIDKLHGRSQFWLTFFGLVTIALLILIYVKVSQIPVQLRREDFLPASQPLIIERNLEQIDNELDRAIARINKAAASGNEQAIHAIEFAKNKREWSQVQEFLRSEANKTRDELVERRKEVATLSFLRGDIEEARTQLEFTISIKPDNLDAVNQYANIFAHNQRPGGKEKARNLYEQVLKNADANSASKAAAFCNLAGQIHRPAKEFEEARDYLNRCLEICKGRNEKEFIEIHGVALTQLAKICEDDELRKTLKAIQKDSTNRSEKDRAANEIESLYKRIDEYYQRAIHEFEKLAKPESGTNRITQAATNRITEALWVKAGWLHRRAALQRERQKNESAKEFSNEAEQLLKIVIARAEESELKIVMMSATGILGRVYYDREDFAEARVLLEQCVTMAMDIGYFREKAMAHELLGNIGRQQQQFDVANRHYKEAERLRREELKDSKAAERIRKQIDQLRTTVDANVGSAGS